MGRVDRRGFFVSLGGVWLAAHVAELRAAADHAARIVRGERPPSFSVLTPSEAATIDAISAQIIPTDDTPGAREAGAVYFIDHALATFAKADLPKTRAGLKDLGARVAKTYPGSSSFEALTSERQHALLAALEQEKSEFFELIRGAVVAGTFAGPEYGGNRDKIGWQLLGFDDRFAWAPPFGYYDRES